MTTDNLPTSALDLYEAPFIYIESTHLIHDAKLDVFFKLYKEDAELGHHIAQALTEYWNRRTASIEQANHSEQDLDMVKAIDLLNRANYNLAQHDIARSLQVEIEEFLSGK
jgi:hypothetical protein